MALPDPVDANTLSDEQKTFLVMQGWVMKNCISVECQRRHVKHFYREELDDWSTAVYRG